LSCWRKLPSLFLEFFPSEHHAPLYWSLPPSVLCQWLRQIMILRGHSLISLLFILVKEYGSRINLEILILHFENKNYFDMSLKQFAFEILQLLGYYFFLGKEMTCSCVWCYCLRWKYAMRWPFVFIGFQSGGLENKLEVLLWEKLVSVFFLTLIFISMNYNE
jgi:hypothetical protein